MDLAKLNSATKYPSILTYHEMGDRGRLNPKVQVPFPAGETLYVNEKVDGTNARIIIPPDCNPVVHGTRRKYLIGSREELLTAAGDLVYAPDYGIVDVLRPIAEGLPPHPDSLRTFYFEVFGAGLPAEKQYTDQKRTSVRLFDESEVPLNVLDMPIEKIAAWRDHGGQRFLDVHFVEEHIECLKHDGLITDLDMVPHLETVADLPDTIEATYEWFKAYEKSECDLGGGKGRSEGVVVRTGDRRMIAKLRFEDYERTLGIKRKQ